MKRILTNNFLLKLAAVVIAILLWGSVRISADAVITKNFTVPVNYINAEYLDQNDLYLKDYPKNVTVSVKAKTSSFQHIRSERFSATADLSKRYGDDPFNKAVSLSVAADAAIESYILEMTCKNGIYLDLVLGRMQEKSFTVEVQTIGELPEGMHLNPEGFSVQPSSVTVRGPESLFSRLNRLMAFVELDGFQGDYLDEKAQITLYDSDNRIIETNENITLSQEEVQVVSDILKTKTVAIAFEGVTGTPAEGYRFGGLKSDLEEVEVVGLKTDLAELTNILIPKTELNINGADRDTDFYLDITGFLPAGITLFDTQNTVKATVYIEKLQEKGFRISGDAIRLEGMSEEYEYELISSSVLVTLEGFSEDLESLSPEELDAYISVEGFVPGTYDNVPVTVELRDGFRVVNHPKLQLKVLSTEETTEEMTEAETAESADSEEEPESSGEENTEQQGEGK